MYAFRAIFRVRVANYLILPTKFIGTPSREILVVIHRGFITWRYRGTPGGPVPSHRGAIRPLTFVSAAAGFVLAPPSSSQATASGRPAQLQHLAGVPAATRLQHFGGHCNRIATG